MIPPKTLSLYQQLEKDRLTLLEEAAGFSAEAFVRKPAPDKWSASEIIQHLVQVERVSVLYLKKKLSGGVKGVENAGLAARLRTWFVKIYLKSPFKVKAPAQVAKTDPTLDLVTVSADWSKARAQLYALLESLPEEVYGKAAFKHPLAGRMSIDQMMEFMLSHKARHWEQLRRLR
jgi:hypothetical protein